MDTRRKLELGSGERPTPGYLHQDVTAQPGVALDFQCEPWEIPLPPGSLDEVIALGVVEHLRFADVARTLAHLHDLLATGGVFVFDVPDMTVWVNYLHTVIHHPDTLASDAAEISPGVGWRLVSRRACHLPVRRVRVLPRSHSIADGRCGAVTLRQLFGSALDSLMIYSRGHRSRGPRLRRGASVRPPSTYARYAYSRPPVGILGSLGASEALPRATGLIPRPASRTRVRPIDHQAVSANLHFHSLVADGVFAAAGTELGAAGPPSDAGDPVDERRSGRRRHTG